MANSSQRWTHIAALFDELVELSPDSRARRLAEIERTDTDLASEVRSLLAADADDMGFLDGGAEVIPELLERGGDGAPADGLAGPYRLLRPLGEGGMGVVWLAERTDGAYEQQVAVKLLKRGMDTHAILRRFLQERRILARLHHAHIVRLVDGGMSADGRPFYVMDHVDGEPITLYAAQHQLGVRARVELLAKVAEAVAYAHTQLIVHRDLKPSNVLVDADGEPRVLDFGIAKIIEESGEQTRTGTGFRVLSPAYAAPEQILGEPIGTATDVYALGLMLCELLVGQLPQQRRARSPGQMQLDVATEVSTRAATLAAHLSTERMLELYGGGFGARRLSQVVAGDLDLIIATALQRDPARRYPTALAFAEDLRRWLERRPINARADSHIYRLRKFVRRNRIGVVATALIALSLIGGLGAALWQARAARAQAHKSELTRAFVVSMFGELNPASSRKGRQMTAEDLVQAGLDRLDKELHDTPKARAELRMVFASALFQLGNVEVAIPTLERGVTELRASHGASASLAEGLQMLASSYKTMGREVEATRLAREALAMFERLPGDHRLAMIRTRTVLANIATRAYRIDEALAMHRAILADRTTLFGAEAMELAVDYHNLSVALNGGDRPVEAETAARHALALLRKAPDSPEARQVWPLTMIGTTLITQGRYADADVVLADAQQVVERTLGAEHFIAGSILSSRARMAVLVGEYKQADALLVKANTLMGEAHKDSVNRNYARWGIALLEQGRDSEAKEVLAAALLSIAERRDVATSFSLLASACHGLAVARSGDVVSGAAESEAALSSMQARGMTETDEYVEAGLCAAEALALAGRAPEAIALRDHVMETFAQVFGTGHPRLARLRSVWPAHVLK